MGEVKNRDAVIVRTSVTGIVVNVLLAAFKAAVGLMSHSIAITLDAVNNLSDAMSSIITIVGTKLAARPADHEHPFGHGRAEYLSAAVISLIVLYAGITSLQESIKKIIHPAAPDYTSTALLIVAVAVVVKIFLGRYVKKTGQKVNSDSLVNSGQDAMLDAVISVSTLVAAAIYLTAGISLEAWLGAIISAVIIKSGIDMLRDTISQILGERVDSSLTKQIKKVLCSFDEIHGAYDLTLHAYGPDRYLGSVHIEVPDTMMADQIDRLERKAAERVYEETGVLLTGIGIYSMNTKSREISEVQKQVAEAVQSVGYILQMHGFYYNEEDRTIRFDVVVSFDSPDRTATCREVYRKVKAMYPECSVYVNMDADISD